MAQLKPHRILVTGSRDWRWPPTVNNALTAERYGVGRMVVVHGGCPTGADAMASWWVGQLEHLGIVEEKHRARWRRNGQRDLSAGFRRNAEMVAEGADVCLAFIGLCDKERCPHRGLHGSHGATHAALLADEADIPVIAYVQTPGTSKIVRLRTASDLPRLKAQLDRLYGRVAS